MCALAAALASLAFVSPVAADASRDVRWVLGPALVELGDGRIRLAVPGGVALVAGDGARTILAAIADGTDGGELAVVSPVAAAETWFVVVAWQGKARGDDPERASRATAGAARVVWLERPRRDDRTGRVSWAFAGRTREGPIVNQHVQIPAGGGAVEVTLVAPVEELSAARVHLARIVEGFGGDVPRVDGKPR